MGRITQKLQVPRVVATPAEVFINTRPDTVAVEEPLDIRVNGSIFRKTTRTPGQDIELVHGLLLAEGLIKNATELSTARYCAGAVGPDNQNSYNVLDLDVLGAQTLPLQISGPACGVPPTPQPHLHWSIEPISPQASTVIALPAQLDKQRPIFQKTKGIEAAALATVEGEILLVREDISAENAVDKVIGHFLMAQQLPQPQTMLIITGKVTQEILKKVAMAGISGVISTESVSSMAIEIAQENQIFLAGFVQDNKFNLYSGEVAKD